MRGVAWIGALVVLGCGAREPREISIGASLEPPPESLAAYVEEVHESGGLVFVGTVTSAPVPTDSVYFEPPSPDVRIEYPRTTATLIVDDALGASMGSEIALDGAGGPPRLVDDEGNPSDEHVLSGGGPDDWRRGALPVEGTWLFLAYPDDGRNVMVWRARVADGVASGEGTQNGEAVSLDDLRVAE